MKFSKLVYTSHLTSGSDAKQPAHNAGDPGLIPGSGRPPGESNGSTFQYSCLENPMDGGAWRATVRGAVKSRTRLATNTFRFHTYSTSQFVLATLKHSIATCGWWQPYWTI